MKKHLHNSLRALFLSLAVLMSLPILAAVEVEIDGIRYDLDAEAKRATVTSLGRNFSESPELVIPESVEYKAAIYKVTSIGDFAFRDCSGFTSVTIPNSVISIGWYAFEYCSGLTSLTIPNSVESIESYAFEDCSGLTSVIIGDGITSIVQGVFNGCSGLTSVTIPHSVDSIGQDAFYNCSGLTSVTIPNSVTSIGHNAFNACSGLTSVTIGNSVEIIGGSAFSGCSGLTSVTVPNSVTSIGRSAFSGCSGLTSVNIPNGVESIGDHAFADCPELLDVYCYAENVPSTKSSAFTSSSISKATLHVPAASIDSYKATRPWSGFGKIVALTPEETSITETEIGNVKSENSAVYDLSGRRVQKAEKGIYIQNGKLMVK